MLILFPFGFNLQNPDACLAMLGHAGPCRAMLVGCVLPERLEVWDIKQRCGGADILPCASEFKVG